MLDASPSLHHRPFRLSRLLLACGLTLAVAVAQAQGQPQAQQVLQPALAASQPAIPTGTTGASSDAVSRFLQERGLLPTASNSNSNSNSGNSSSPGTPKGLLSQVRDKASDLVLASMDFLGVPYKRGGSSAESGFDCSGFTRHIFEMSVGLVLPHRADEQARLSSLMPIKKDELKPGDLVFFNTMRRTFSHVGIYVGDGKFIHAPRTGSKVRVEDMREAYWAKRFTGARRADLSAADKSSSAATALN